MHNAIFQKITGYFLLALFVLCNTPTPVLHRWFANHGDQTTQDYKINQQAQISVSGINCHCVGHVTTAPYLPGTADWLPEVSFTFHRFTSELTNDVPFTQLFHSSLRAPPALI